MEVSGSAVHGGVVNQCRVVDSPGRDRGVVSSRERSASEEFQQGPDQVDCYQCGLPEWLEGAVVADL